MTRYQNRHNKADGQNFEALIVHSCQNYKRLNLAMIDKTPEPMRVARPMGKGKFLAFFERKAQPDFKGVLRTGRSICFEAKHTNTSRATFNQLKEWQLNYLKNHERLGGHSFILLGVQMSYFYKIPVQTWENMKQRYGRLYMTLEELEPYRVQSKNGLIDFLKTNPN